MINKNILYFTRTMGLGGTENVVLQLCEIMSIEANKIVICSCGGVNTKVLKEMGIKHYKIPDIENKNIFTIIKVIMIVSKIIRREKITIIHTHHRMAAFYTTILSYFYKFKFVSTVHNIFYNKKLLTRYSYNKAKLIAVGNKVKTNLCEFYNIPDRQITVINNSVRASNFKVDYIEVLNDYKNKGFFLVGNIGRISEQKGMEYYIKSIPKVIEKFPKTKFFIIGEGEDREKIVKLIEKFKLSNVVHLLGYRKDIQNIMYQLDLIVLSSLWEGFPLTPIEAFSVGKTVVATDVDGTNEIIANNYNGILVKSKDSESMSNAIIKLIENDSLRKELENNARITYSDKFDFDKLCSKYYKFYTTV